MNVSRRQSLEAKMTYLIIALLFVVVLGLGHVTLIQQRSALIQSKLESFQAISELYGVALQPSLTSSQRDLSKKLATQLRKANAEMEFVVLENSKGEIIFEDSKRTTLTEEEKGLLGHSSKRILGVLLAVAGIDSNEIHRASVPVTLSDGSLGTLKIAFSLRSVNKTIEHFQSLVFFWFAVTFIVGIIGALILARSMTAQIRTLSQGAWKVMAGDLTVQIPVRSEDEIGDLANTFNLMVAQLREDQERLEKRANTDSLTGLYNHRFFQERLAEEIKRAGRHDREISLIMLDLDHFKAFNDAHGHPAGDAALKATAELLKQCVRDIDVVGRYGGEEFAVILPECGLADATATAERIRLAVQRHCFYGKLSDPVPMSVSIGVANYPQHSQEREGLIFAADVALYQSKNLGRNRVTCFTGVNSKESDDAPYRFYVALHATDMATVEYLAEAVDAKHGHPPHFSRSVADLAVDIAARMGMGEEDLNSIRIACLLKDIGQIGIPDAILKKNGPLSEEERRTVESHPSLSYRIVERSPHFNAMLPGILHHHERWDGAGYPFGLAGEKIPLVARIISVADAYRAMTVDRPHRASLSHEEAIIEIRKCSGTQFDPEIVELLFESPGFLSSSAAA